MHRLVILLASLALVFSVGVTPVAHAAEPIGCIDASTSEVSGHSAGDSDEVPADGEKGYPHHHGGCQGHQIAAPVDAALALTHDSTERPLDLAQSVALHGATTDPALRPPQA